MSPSEFPLSWCNFLHWSSRRLQFWLSVHINVWRRLYPTWDCGHKLHLFRQMERRCPTLLGYICSWYFVSLSPLCLIVWISWPRHVWNTFVICSVLSPPVKKCPTLSPPSHGSLSCSDPHGEFSFGSRCKSSCNRGFVLNGTAETECNSLGKWTSNRPRCLGETNLYFVRWSRYTIELLNTWCVWLDCTFSPKWSLGRLCFVSALMLSIPLWVTTRNRKTSSKWIKR